jgi:hypothetical protein
MIDILVFTYDKNTFLITKQLALFERVWTLPYMLTYIIAGNTTELTLPRRYDYERTRFLTMRERGFAGNLLYYVERLLNPFMMLMDDFMLFEVNNDLLLTAWFIASAPDVGCVRLVPWPGPTLPYARDENFGEIDKSLEYAISLQASMWKPRTFLDLLDAGWNPWEIELNGSKRAATYDKRFIGCKTCAVNYWDYMMRGNRRPKHADLVDQEIERGRNPQ